MAHATKHEKLEEILALTDNLTRVSALHYKDRLFVIELARAGAAIPSTASVRTPIGHAMAEDAATERDMTHG